jgi:Kdo2-lipid IVA lauroyltransferase/acyltransferase
MRMIAGIAKALPASVVFGAARIMGRIGFSVNGFSRSRAINNVRTCFPQESYRRQRQIAIKGFQHMTLAAMDLLRAPKANSEAVRCLNIANKHYVTDAVKEGKGVVIVSAHFGNIGVLPAAFDGVSEHPAYIMRRPTRRVSCIINKARAYRDRYLKPRTTFESVDSSIAGAIKLAHLLKRGNVVIVLADLTWGSGAVLVDLFGIPYEMSRLPATLAIKHRVALIPVMTLRNAAGTYEVVVAPPIERPNTPDDMAESAMTKEFAGILERYVRSSPEQWCWTHQQRWHPSF